MKCICFSRRFHEKALRGSENKLPIKIFLTKLRRYVVLYIIDHGLVRSLYQNLHSIGANYYRSSQPSPRQLRRHKAMLKIRTVINLRGENESSAVWQLEKEECERLGLHLINIRLLSRSFPHPEDINQIIKVLKEIPFPVLVHCKSGADRAGLFSVIYRYVHLNEPLDQSLSELSLRYGHVKFARTGMLDKFFELFQQANSATKISLEKWIMEDYDREFLKNEFDKATSLNRFGDFLINKILRRE